MNLRKISRCSLFAKIVALVSITCMVVSGWGFFNPIASYAAGGIFSNPKRNLQLSPLASGTGNCVRIAGGVAHCQSPCYPHLPKNYKSTTAYIGMADTKVCSDFILRAIEKAHRLEHIRPLVLPGNYYRLNVDEQLFVVLDLERVDRGLPPYVGITTGLDQVAKAAAEKSADPPFSTTVGQVTVATGGGFYRFASIWAGDSANPLSADFGWMYDDGWGGNADKTWNYACTSPTSVGCWGHRDNILGNYTGQACTNCLMGVGYAAKTKSGWNTSYAALFLEPAESLPRMTFTWNGDVLPFLHTGYERIRA